MTEVTDVHGCHLIASRLARIGSVHGQTAERQTVALPMICTVRASGLEQEAAARNMARAHFVVQGRRLGNVSHSRFLAAAAVFFGERA